MSFSKTSFPAWLRSSAAVLAIFLISAVFTTANLEVSRKIGRLSTVSNYDDVVYLNLASTIYFTGKTQGPGAAAALLFGKELHAPFPVVNGLAGFVLFGPDVERVYHMLTLVVFAFLLFIAATTRGLPVILRAGLVLGSLAIPFATMCALEFRPDLMWATVLGGSGVLFLGAAHPFRKWSPSVLYGLALGAVLLIKPSTFAMTLLVLGGVWFLVALREKLCGNAGWRQIAVGWLLTALAAIVVCGWYVIPHGSEILGYFYSNSFGQNKDVWIYKGGLLDRWTYYLRGAALQSNPGYFFLPLLGLYLWGAIRDLWKGEGLEARLRGGSFLWMLVCLFGVNAVFAMKSPFLGGAFYGFLIFGGFWYLARLLASAPVQAWLTPLPRQIAAACALAGLAWVGFSFPEVCRVSRVSADTQTSVNRALLSDLLARAPQGRRTILLLTQGNPVVGEYLQMEFRRRGLDLRIHSAAMMRSAGEVIAFAQRPRYAVVQDPGMLGTPQDAIPGEKLQPELIAYFHSNPDWKLVSEYPDKSGKRAYLYERLTRRP
jgi:hypothetical protein